MDFKKIKSRFKKKSKSLVEKKLRDRLDWLVVLESNIAESMATSKPSEMAELREEHECLKTLISEFKEILEGD